MLTKLFVDNYRCLNNFDLPLQKLSLFLGENGAGKSMTLQVLTVLRRVILGGEPIKWLGEDTRARWSTNDRQCFELTLTGEPGTYVYRLVVDYSAKHGAVPRARIAEEHLALNGHPLLAFESGSVTLYGDDHRPRPPFQLVQNQSALATVVAGPGERHLDWFRDYIKRMVLMRLQPHRMKTVAEDESVSLGTRGENFASWYRRVSQEHQDRNIALTLRLREVLPGFHAFKLSRPKQQLILQVGFASEDGTIYHYKFNELSDGQRVLIVLYTLLYMLRDQAVTLFIDEPQEHVALAELQPWLVEMRDAVEDGALQVLLISHHPELIDFLARDAGVWLARSPNGATRIVDPPADDGSGLALSTRIARGWVP